MRKFLYAIPLLVLAACTRIPDPAVNTTPDSVAKIEETPFVTGVISVKVSEEMAEALEKTGVIPPALAAAGISSAGVRML